MKLSTEHYCFVGSFFMLCCKSLFRKAHQRFLIFNRLVIDRLTRGMGRALVLALILIPQVSRKQDEVHICHFYKKEDTSYNLINILN